jgi:hypothetical protein
MSAPRLRREKQLAPPNPDHADALHSPKVGRCTASCGVQRSDVTSRNKAARKKLMQSREITFRPTKKFSFLSLSTVPYVRNER